MALTLPRMDKGGTGAASRYVAIAWAGCAALAVAMGIASAHIDGYA